MMFGMCWDGFGRVLGIFFGGGWEGSGGGERGRKIDILENVWECFSRVGGPRNSIFSTKIKGDPLITIFHFGARGPAAGGEALRIVYYSALLVTAPKYEKFPC